MSSLPPLPEQLLLPPDEFRQDLLSSLEVGKRVAARSTFSIVGLARNCALPLEKNLAGLESVAREFFSGWRIHVETNDNDDDTVGVLKRFADSAGGRLTYRDQTLGRTHFTAEYAGRRTEALAEYRSACQLVVASHRPPPDYVLAVDFDAWGGFGVEGLLSGIAFLSQQPQAFGVAAVSLIHMSLGPQSGEQKAWLHYDAWALRLNSYYDDYTRGAGGWKHAFFPPVGSPAIPVCSAFGGMAVYKTQDYLVGEYDGKDCEHVTFHESIARKTGRSLYLVPAMRTIMKWEQDWNDGGSH